jgi:hypothetical protein
VVVTAFTPLRQTSTLVATSDGVHESATFWTPLTLLPVAVSEMVGAGGGGAGVTAFDGVDGADVPTPFVAVTVNVYGVPLVKPVTVHEVAPEEAHVLDSGEEVTV